MIRSLVVLTFLAFAVPEARAGLPSPQTSQCDPVLVGNSTGVDRGNAFHVTVRDYTNSPESGSVVSIHFVSGPTRLVWEQNPGITVSCGFLYLSRVADSGGTTAILARFGGFDNTAEADVRADGVLLRHITVRSTDLDGDGTTALSDLNLFRQRYLSSPASPETDYNQDGTTNLADFAIFRAEYLAGVRNTVCP
jgi:hypothetical protein